MGVLVILHAVKVVLAMNSRHRYKEVKIIPIGISQVWFGSSLLMRPLEIFGIHVLWPVEMAGTLLVLSGGFCLIYGMSAADARARTMLGCAIGCAVFFTLAACLHVSGVI